MKLMLQRLLALLWVLCLFLSLAACAGIVPETGTAATPGTTASTEPNTTEIPETSPRPTEGIDDHVIPESPAEDAGAKAEMNFFGYGAASDAATAAVGGSAFYSTEGVFGKKDLSLADAPSHSDWKSADGSGSTDGEILPGDPPGESVTPEEPVPPAEPLKLTAAEWKDNDNWPFFTNLVNAETIAFPSFGLDPRNRIKVTVTDAAGAPQPNAPVSLYAGEAVVWQGRTDKNGVAYLFYGKNETPDRVASGDAEAPIQVEDVKDDPQSKPTSRTAEDVTLTAASALPQTGMQIMFIVDTTGSMGDEIAYLQKDFSAIAERVGSEGVAWSVNFYRDEGDEYVTRTNGFTSDVAEVQAKINAEYADGGGDTPEAVAEILTECLKGRTDWDEGSVKLAFLIFDAPPHGGKEAELQAAVSAAAAKGIRLIPVVASNADRDTELFGRAAAILTGGTYVFLTDDSGIGDSHLEPIVGNYEVELLQDLIVRVIEEYRP